MPNEEYLSSNALIAYPFKQEQDLPRELVGAFADASVQSKEYKAELTSFAYSIDTGEVEFEVNNVRFSATVTPSSTYIRVSNAGSIFVLDAQYLNTIPSFLYEGSALFEESCVYVDTDSVTTIEFYYGKGDPRNFMKSGDISFISGYNMSISDSNSDLTLNAKPGAGFGVVPCSNDCEEDPETDGKPLVTDNGNAVITGDGCYEVTASGDTIKIHGKCVACCQCSSYVDVVEDLKKIANTVKRVNTDITETKTNLYFDTMDKYSLVYNKPDVDVQLDIAPDASIASIPRNGNLEDGVDLREFHSFRVTCTVTNMCGLPCYFSVPDMWTAEEIRSTNAMHVFVPNKRNKAGKILKVSEQLANGIEAVIIPKKGAIGYAINSQVGRWDENGWVQTSYCRGPLIRRIKDRTIKKKYETPHLAVPYMSDDELGVNSAINRCSDWALEDLRKKQNPSSTLKYAETATAALCADDARAGFLMPAGYSITITNTYMFPAYGINFKKDEAAIRVLFLGQFYCPLAAYTMAYNMARPSDSTITYTDEGMKVSWRWEAGRYYTAAATPQNLKRMVFVWKSYGIADGKEELLAPVQ